MAIEKGRLIDILNQPAEGFTTTAVGPIPSTSLTGKDKKLLLLPSSYRKRQANRYAQSACRGLYCNGG